MPAFICKDVTNLVAPYLTKNSRSVFMNGEMFENCAFWELQFDVAKFTALTTLSLRISYKLSFPMVFFENILCSYFFTEISQQNCHVILRELIEYTLQFLIKLWLISSLLSSVGVCTFRTLSVINKIMSLINSTLITFGLIPLYTKKACP